MWPKWVLERRCLYDRRPKQTNHPEERVRNSVLKVKTICKTCDDGWISQLDLWVKPLLAPISEDTPVLLDTEQQQILAVWIMKMALILDSATTRDPPKSFYRKEDYLGFKEALRVPCFTRIWIGRLSSADREMVESRFARPYEAERLKGTVMTLMNEHLIAQVVSLRLPHVITIPGEIKVSPKRGEWDKCLTTIWPHQHTLVTWPPAESFGRAGLNACLVDRWRIETDAHAPLTRKMNSVDEARSAPAFRGVDEPSLGNGVRGRSV